MTNGKPISGSSARVAARNQGVRGIEAELRNLHEAVQGAQREADSLLDARQSAIDDVVRALWSEATWFDDSGVEMEWAEPDDELSRRLLADADELDDLVGEFLDTGALPRDLPETVRRFNRDTGDIWEWQVAQQLQEARADFEKTREDRAPHAQRARALVDETWSRVAQLIQAWVDDPPKTATEDWGRVLRGWRQALGLTGSRAAEVLGVSPPAVTRYEKGSRSPSLAYVESMAKRIIDHGAEPPEEAAALFRLASMLGASVTEIMESVESERDSEHDVRQQFSAVVDSLPVGDVRLLLAVAQDPDAVTALRSVPLQDELAALRGALASLVREGG